VLNGLKLTVFSLIAADGSALAEASNDKDVDVRKNAVMALGRIPHSAVVRALIEALESVHANVRSLAANELGKLGDKAPDPGEVIKHREIGSFRKVGGKSRAAISLLRLLEDVDINVRRNAAAALGKISDRSAVGLLVNALQDKDPELRRNATQALGQLGDRSTTEVLIDASRDASHLGYIWLYFPVVRHLGYKWALK
jgi:HEAT repeat protein